MILRNVIQRVQSSYSKGVQSDDTRLTSRHIYDKLVSSRAKLLVQKSNKNQLINQQNYDYIPCLKVKEGEVHDCPGIPPTGCTIYKSVDRIPNLISDMDKHLFQSVTTLDGSIVFSEISWTEKKYKNGNKFTANSPDFIFRDQYIILTSPKPPKKLVITALFEDPIKVEIYRRKNCIEDCEDCVECGSFLDIDFPFDASMEDALVDLATQELIDKFNKSIEDLRNDTKDNISEQTK